MAVLLFYELTLRIRLIDSIAVVSTPTRDKCRVPKLELEGFVVVAVLFVLYNFGEDVFRSQHIVFQTVQLAFDRSHLMVDSIKPEFLETNNLLPGISTVQAKRFSLVVAQQNCVNLLDPKRLYWSTILCSKIR